MKISVISPVKNEAQFIGYSVISVLPYVHELLYGVAESDDATYELLLHIKQKYAGDKLKIFTDLKLDDGHIPLWDFNPLDMKAYNASYNYLIQEAKGDAVWFLHPDMIVTKWVDPQAGSLAWTTKVISYARDMNTIITKGRCDQWKNIHAKRFGLHYYGGYGSQNEDFYHSEITGKSYRHYGTEFSKYPFEVTPTGIEVNHYCELKPYKRRLEKMKLCMKTLAPTATPGLIDEMATHHPRVSLEPSSKQFGHFEFGPTPYQVPEVFSKYKDEFSSFKKQEALCG